MKKRIRLYTLTFAIVTGIAFAVFDALPPGTWPILQPYYSKQIRREANSILAEARQNLGRATEDYRESYVFSALAEAQSLAGNAAAAHQSFLQARQTADHIKDIPTQVEALKDLAQALRESGSVTEARQTLRDAARAAGTIASVPPKDWVSRRDYELQHIGEAQAQAGNLADAQNTADEIHDSRTKSLVLSIIAERQVEMGKLTEANRTIQNADSHDRAIILSEIADAQMKAGKVAEARQTILDALHTATAITRAGAQTLAWAAIADSQARAGNTPGALQTANRIDSNSTKQTTLRCIVGWQAKAGNVVGAGETTAKITDITARSAAMQAISEEQKKLGDTTGAETTAQTAYQMALKAGDSSSVFYALASIAGEQAKAKDITGRHRTLQKAAQVVEMDGDSLLKSIALIEIADAQIENGDAAEAVKNLEDCSDDSSKVQRLEAASLAQTKAGEAAEARNTLKDASLTIENIISNAKGPDIANPAAFSHIVALQEQAGNPAGALKTLRQLHNAVKKISDSSDKSIALSHIIIGLFAPQ